MGDLGMKVTGKGSDLADAKLKDQLLNTKWPFAKIDMTNQAGFKNMRVTFNNDVPYNGDGSERTTNIFKFKHNSVDPKGNKLWPAFWALVRNNNTSPGAQPYFQGGGQIAATSTDAYVTLNIWADQDYIYFDAVKAYYPPSGDTNPTLVGTILEIRTYIFVEDLKF